jgi:hypothetical protein
MSKFMLFVGEFIYNLYMWLGEFFFKFPKIYIYFIFILVLVFLFAFALGDHYATMEFRQKAIESGAGEYVPMPETAKKKFEFKRKYEQ